MREREDTSSGLRDEQHVFFSESDDGKRERRETLREKERTERERERTREREKWKKDQERERETERET